MSHRKSNAKQHAIKKPAPKKPAPKVTPVRLAAADPLAELTALFNYVRRHDYQLVVGIDPGYEGAIAFVTHGKVVAFDMPVIRGKKPGVKSKAVLGYDEETICAYLKLFVADEATRDSVFVAVEKAQIGGKGGLGRGGKGDTPMTAFKAAWGCAMFALFLTASGVRHEFVPPTVWKKAAGLTGKDKAASKMLAQKLYPNVGLPLKKDEARAEAILIARHVIIKHNLNLADGTGVEAGDDEEE